MTLRSTSVTIGSEVGDTCPVCRKGTVEEMGGCNTCTNCNAQLKCGLLINIKKGLGNFNFPSFFLFFDCPLYYLRKLRIKDV